MKLRSGEGCCLEGYLKTRKTQTKRYLSAHHIVKSKGEVTTEEWNPQLEHLTSNDQLAPSAKMSVYFFCGL